MILAFEGYDMPMTDKQNLDTAMKKILSVSKAEDNNKSRGQQQKQSFCASSVKLT
jgi:hypothetical protein